MSSSLIVFRSGASGEGDLDSGADDDDDAPSAGESARVKGEAAAEGESSARRATPAAAAQSGSSSPVASTPGHVAAAASKASPSGPSVPQPMLQPMPSLEDLVAKSMLFFGEISVSSAQAAAPQVPLVMPMVYLLPVSPKSSRSGMYV